MFLSNEAGPKLETLDFRFYFLETLDFRFYFLETLDFRQHTNFLYFDFVFSISISFTEVLKVATQYSHFDQDKKEKTFLPNLFLSTIWLYPILLSLLFQPLPWTENHSSNPILFNPNHPHPRFCGHSLKTSHIFLSPFVEFADSSFLKNLVLEISSYPDSIAMLYHAIFLKLYGWPMLRLISSYKPHAIS